MKDILDGPTDILDGPHCAATEREIDDALAALGCDSDSVAGNLTRLGYLDTAGDPVDALCEYLQDRLDRNAEHVIIDDCDAVSVDYQVINPDGETWTHGSTGLSWPVIIFFCRHENGELGEAA